MAALASASISGSPPKYARRHADAGALQRPASQKLSVVHADTRGMLAKHVQTQPIGIGGIGTGLWR